MRGHREITLDQLHLDARGYVEAARDGLSFDICVGGEPVARLVPPEVDPHDPGAQQVVAAQQDRPAR